MTGYDYGNARLRARRHGLLRREHYAGLLGRGGPELLVALAASSYLPQAEAAEAATGGWLMTLYRAARDHLVAALTGVAGFYSGRAREVVTALLGRFDAHNTLVLLRAAHHGTTPDPALLIPVGRLGAGTAREAAGQPDLPAAARLLAARRLPDPAAAPVLLATAHRYELDTGLAAVEQAVTHAAWAHQLGVLGAAGPAADEALAAFRRETDDRNLLLALRLRESAGQHRAGAPAAGLPPLPGGTLPAGQLAAVRQAPARAGALAALAPVRRAWQGPLTAWAGGGDLATLQAGLETARLRAECRRLRRGDPLGAATAAHYVLAHQVQARNVQLLAQAAVGVLTQDEVRHHLVIDDPA
ncbi:MAG TPA: V-type ATPase subunit [Streptosporangiaceae bacterium]|nr:V-type ATPase subunit [Streptosporangiaceae bacterium]